MTGSRRIFAFVSLLVSLGSSNRWIGVLDGFATAPPRELAEGTHVLPC
jgi:hypothetical protein